MCRFGFISSWLWGIAAAGDCGHVVGTCNHFSCFGFRGLTTCSGGRCLCFEGYCNQAGICTPQNHVIPGKSNMTATMCQRSSCPAALGPTSCEGERCVCTKGMVGQDGRCHPRAASGNSSECRVDTGGRCFRQDCFKFRGPTVCQDGRCLCVEGYCVDADGRCVPDLKLSEAQSWTIRQPLVVLAAAAVACSAAAATAARWRRQRGSLEEALLSS
mmetsp:Transcript_42627/g.112377  ORF Transcript_42627/g.112377 Transcript_42627/m.112377 type:complete len:215 (+) Transcript_42627:11-655(+)